MCAKQLTRNQPYFNTFLVLPVLSHRAGGYFSLMGMFLKTETGWKGGWSLNYLIQFVSLPGRLL